MPHFKEDLKTSKARDPVSDTLQRAALEFVRNNEEDTEGYKEKHHKAMECGINIMKKMTLDSSYNIHNDDYPFVVYTRGYFEAVMAATQEIGKEDLLSHDSLSAEPNGANVIGLLDRALSGELRCKEYCCIMLHLVPGTTKYWNERVG